jgi:hypothetical protein
MSDMVPSHQSSAPEQPLVVIGDVTLTEHWLVTPAGTTPLAGTEIFVTDFTRVESKIPTWAIVLAIIGFFFALLGLLFLLVREQVATGYVQVTVRNGPVLHTTNVPAAHAGTAPDVFGRVQYARHLIAQAA